MKVINLFGGPSSGKTTTALGLAHLMKINGYNVEYIPELARDLIYQERTKILKDVQIYLVADIETKFKTLEKKVDYLLLDSPIILSNIYAKNYYKSFYSLVLEIFNNYDNINFVLERNFEYQHDNGRIHNEEESNKIQNKIIKLLNENNIDFSTIKTNLETHKELYSIITNLH